MTDEQSGYPEFIISCGVAVVPELTNLTCCVSYKC